MRGEAVEALIAARDAFGSAGARGEEAERIERVSADLNAMIESLGGPAAEPEEIAPEESFEDAPTEDAPAEDQESTPVDAEDPDTGEG